MFNEETWHTPSLFPKSILYFLSHALSFLKISLLCCMIFQASEQFRLFFPSPHRSAGITDACTSMYQPFTWMLGIKLKLSGLICNHLCCAEPSHWFQILCYLQAPSVIYMLAPLYLNNTFTLTFPNYLTTIATSNTNVFYIAFKLISVSEIIKSS